jgi:hypothetical protein
MKSLPDFSKYQMCPKCQITAGKRQFSAPHTHKDFSRRIEHYSLAPVNPDEVAALRAKLPSEIEMSIDPNDELYGIPISRNETERKIVLKAAGHVDL